MDKPVTTLKEGREFESHRGPGILFHFEIQMKSSMKSSMAFIRGNRCTERIIMPFRNMAVVRTR